MPASRLISHQLTPLKRPLDQPANLFIADDVGLGKTVEAASSSRSSLCADEMERRFGLRFEVYNRAFVALAERGAAEPDALRGILRTQRTAIQKAITKLPQLTLAFAPTEPKIREQVRQIEQASPGSTGAPPRRAFIF